MSDTTMPAADATNDELANESEFVAYELAYHVLPTVAEGEVVGVTDALKKLITDHQGEVFDEEAAERFELAYEIEKYLEGRNRRFGSAYFGWIRFRLEPNQVPSLEVEINHQKSILRHLIVRLTKVEEATPFRFHPALAEKRVETRGEDEEVTVSEGEEVVENATTEAATTDAPETPAEKAAE